MPKPNKTVKFISRLEHRSQVMELRVAGYTYEQIGEIMAEREGRYAPYSKQAIHKTVSRMLEESRSHFEADLEYLRALEAERLDLLMQRPFKMALEGNLSALDKVLKIMERRAKLFGIDQLPKQQTDPDKEPCPNVVLYVPDNGRGPID